MNFGTFHILEAKCEQTVTCQNLQFALVKRQKHLVLKVDPKVTTNPTIFNIIFWVDCLIDQASDGPSIILID